MATANIKFHRITATSGSDRNTGTTYKRGEVYFIKSATGNTGKVYICTAEGTGAAATLEDYSVNTWRPIENNLTSTSTTNSLSAAMGKSLNDSITTLSNSLPNLNNAVQITYAELKSLRDAGNLVPGQQYRITDYATTTVQENTISAGHQFDIIVTADSESTLNEVARAIQHTGNTYFNNCNLNAWQLWYCLDNDIDRFAWADSTNGKGVIYRMIDEWNNDVPYDFKNIQFKHPNNGTEYPDYYYTFSIMNNNVVTDHSLLQGYCYSNIIKDYINTQKQYLNNNVFLNSFLRLGGSEVEATICYSNSFGYDCYSNSFGDSCNSNSFGNTCSSNSFDDDCSSNSFGNGCYYNTFGNNCYDNSFGNDCYPNSFGNNCNSNSFGNNCNSNSFGDRCSSNSFGDRCSSNSFGNDCRYIRFASDSSASTKYHYYQNNHFGDGCRYIVFTGTETASSSAQVQNYNFAQGLQGASSTYLTIDGKRNRSFETKAAKNSNGELKIYCEADLIL